MKNKLTITFSIFLITCSNFTYSSEQPSNVYNEKGETVKTAQGDKVTLVRKNINGEVISRTSSTKEELHFNSDGKTKLIKRDK